MSIILRKNQACRFLLPTTPEKNQVTTLFINLFLQWRIILWFLIIKKLLLISCCQYLFNIPMSYTASKMKVAKSLNLVIIGFGIFVKKLNRQIRKSILPICVEIITLLPKIMALSMIILNFILMLIFLRTILKT